MAILICRTRLNVYEMIDTNNIARARITEFTETGNIKVDFYTSEYEMIPVSVTLRGRDEVEALLTIWKNEGFYLIENGHLDLWQGQGLFRSGGSE